MRVAALDLGTNTFRLLIADIVDGIPREVAREQIITRLGGGYEAESNRLNGEAINRAIEALVKFSGFIEKHKPQVVWAVGTEIIRRADNGDYFKNLVKERSGINIETIGPDKEAALAFSGISAYLPPGLNEYATLDIGGGSTEWTLADQSGRMSSWVSLPLGVVELAEKIIDGDPPSAESLLECEQRVSEAVVKAKDRLSVKKPVSAIIGTGGTATSLAIIDLGLEHYDARRVQNHRISFDEVRSLEDRLKKMAFEERANVFPLGGGREDVIIPGAIITRITLNIFEANELLVSDAGLLEGVLLGAVRSK